MNSPTIALRQYRLIPLILSLGLAACGGGGGGGGGGGTASSAPASGGSISGGAVKGPVAGATICAYAADGSASNGLGSKVNLVAGNSVTDGCYVTGRDGSYTLALPAGAPRNLVVTASGGSYCSDESQVSASGSCTSGSLMTLDTPLVVALSLPATDGSATAYASPLSTAAWQNARSNGSSFETEFETLKTTLGLDSTVHIGTAFADGNAGAALKTLFGQVAQSVRSGGSADLGSAIATLAQGTVPAEGAIGAACARETTVDATLRCLIAAWNVSLLEDAPVVSDAMFNAGRALFEGTTGQQLSGPKTVSCASCHPTSNAGVETALALHASLGGGTIHRNAPDLVNKPIGGRHAMFWDGRVALNSDGSYHTPAGDKLPAGLDSLLAAQALFPLLSRDEMLGPYGNNDLANLNPAGAVESDPQPVWDGIMARVKANATLLPLLQAAYPGVSTEDFGIQHVANALAAFQTRRWNPVRTPAYFNAYLAGNGDLTDKAKRGGVLFFGKAGCANCHNGPLLSDGKYHNIGVPQIGPGFGSGASDTPPRDLGRYEVSGLDADRYTFLTPSLWEAKVTPPYLHNGVHASLEKVVRHHLDAAASARAFRCADAPSGVSCRDSESDSALYEDMLDRLAPELATPIALTDTEISELLTFLNQLTNGAN